MAYNLELGFFVTTRFALTNWAIIIWLNAEHKLTNERLIDSVICAEIPEPDANPRLYEVVKSFMIHGPCGNDRKSSPCMVKSKCSKHFSKKFIDRTSFDEDGYCKYRRRDHGHFVEKNGIQLDNRYVVPYNPTLLLRYQAHINVEFCNQSRSIKYLFKYVSKGHDKVTAKLSNSASNVANQENVDEIQTYYDCRYISPCEAVWRIFGFDINFREPSVERLPFYLPNQQGIVFQDDDPIDSVVFRDCREWFERKSGRSIGRLYYVSPGLDACYVMGLLNDDKEYIEGIVEGSKWSSGSYLSKLFATLLIHNTIARPAFVWENTWIHLSDDILLKEQHRTGNPDDDRVKEFALAEIENHLRTAHSRFAIPLNISENSTCHILQGSDLAELIVHTKLIIWDEAPMAHRHCFEALDRSLRDIMQSQNPELDIVLASLNASYLWSSCKVLTLTKNMRLAAGNSIDENKSIAEFADWILKIGDGSIGKSINDEEHEIIIDDDILITDVIDPIRSIVDSTYPQFLSNCHNHQYFCERAILSPTLEDVAHVNDFMLDLLPGEERIYLSSDSICN
ncbi:ATP-dependent DNA helicase PIF1 [Senna tora]|uniref:ATP-dependent DNA helicase n=1 Tax=Senna tora TaxID=362788 RepID=A0A834T8L0_9FABA|nr:ATP-dependent DNA helicase PIF1 [Senna tora]